jgi:hypothetical protein
MDFTMDVCDFYTFNYLTVAMTYFHMEWLVTYESVEKGKVFLAYLFTAFFYSSCF